MTRSRAPTRITEIHPADENHRVLTVEGGDGTYMRRPCAECPWRRDAPIGAFPAEAFRHSARTAYDAALSQFACHMSGVAAKATCAGFLLRNSRNNIGTRLALASGRIDLREVSTDVELYDSYREMAEANGVAPDDPALAQCRGDDE